MRNFLTWTFHHLRDQRGTIPPQIKFPRRFSPKIACEAVAMIGNVTPGQPFAQRAIQLEPAIRSD